MGEGQGRRNEGGSPELGPQSQGLYSAGTLPEEGLRISFISAPGVSTQGPGLC